MILSSILLVCISLNVSAQEFPEVDCTDIFFQVVPHPDPRRCAEFSVCMKGERVDFRCGPETIFNLRSNRCVPGDQRTCGDLPVPEDACVDQFISINPHPSNCGRFFVCMRGFPVVFDCDDNSVFSVFHSRCMLGNRETCQVEEAGPYMI